MISSCRIFFGKILFYSIQGVLMKKLFLVSMFALVLTGCGSTTVPEPIGIGGDVDELKKSPCACIEIPQNYNEWLING